MRHCCCCFCWWWLHSGTLLLCFPTQATQQQVVLLSLLPGCCSPWLCCPPQLNGDGEMLARPISAPAVRWSQAEQPDKNECAYHCMTVHSFICCCAKLTSVSGLWLCRTCRRLQLTVRSSSILMFCPCRSSLHVLAACSTLAEADSGQSACYRAGEIYVTNATWKTPVRWCVTCTWLLQALCSGQALA